MYILFRHVAFFKAKRIYSISVGNTIGSEKLRDVMVRTCGCRKLKRKVKKEGVVKVGVRVFQIWYERKTALLYP